MNRLRDDEAPWALMSHAWQARDERPHVDPHALRLAVLQDTRRMRRSIAVEVALSVVAGALAVSFAARAPGSRSSFVLVDTLAVLLIVWAFALWGRRGLWAPAAETSEAYVALARRRTQLKLWTTWFALALVAGQLAADALFGGGIAILQLMAAAAWVAWAAWMQTRVRRELAFYDQCASASAAGSSSPV